MTPWTRTQMWSVFVLLVRFERIFQFLHLRAYYNELQQHTNLAGAKEHSTEDTPGPKTDKDKSDPKIDNKDKPDTAAGWKETTQIGTRAHT